VSPVNGSWNAAASWSTGAVPAETDHVCIDVAGTYQVTLDDEVSVRSLTLGGGAGAPTLSVLHSQADRAGLTLGGASTIQAGGVLGLRSNDAVQPAVFIRGSGAVTNHGVLRAVPGAGRQVGLSTSLTNAAAGRVEVEDDFVLVSTVINDGAFAVGPGARLDLLGGSFDSNPGSTIEVGGAFEGGNTTFTQAGGTVTGGPVGLSGGSTLVDSAGAGSFVLWGGGAANQLSGTIQAGQTVAIQGRPALLAATELQGTVVNDGTLQLEEIDSVAALNGPGNLTNTGTIRTLGPPGGSGSSGST